MSDDRTESNLLVSSQVNGEENIIKADTFVYKSKRSSKMTKPKFIFLEGTACTGKTSLLEKLQNVSSTLHGLKIKCVFNDYKEMVDIFPLYRLKRNHGWIDALYNIHQYMLLFQTMQDDDDPDVIIFDRSPLASLAYNIILKRTPKVKEVKSELSYLKYKPKNVLSFTKEQQLELEYNLEFHTTNIKKILPKLFETNNWFMYMFKETDLDVNVERMRRRNNGLDIISNDYVYLQNHVFEGLASCLDSSKVQIIDVTQCGPEHFSESSPVLDDIITKLYFHE